MTVEAAFWGLFVMLVGNLINSARILERLAEIKQKLEGR